MENAEKDYKGAVEPSYKNLLEQMLTVLATAGKWEENPPDQKITPRQVNALKYYIKGMYIIVRGWSKLTCLIHGPGDSSDECRVLNDFGCNYTNVRPFKECR